MRKRYPTVSPLSSLPAITEWSVVLELVPGLDDDCNLISLQAQRSHDLQFILVINYLGVASLSIPSNYRENILAGLSPPPGSPSNPVIYQLVILYTDIQHQLIPINTTNTNTIKGMKVQC